MVAAAGTWLHRTRSQHLVLQPGSSASPGETLTLPAQFSRECVNNSSRRLGRAGGAHAPRDGSHMPPAARSTGWVGKDVASPLHGAQPCIHTCASITGCKERASPSLPAPPWQHKEHQPQAESWVCSRAKSCKTGEPFFFLSGLKTQRCGIPPKAAGCIWGW